VDFTIPNIIFSLCGLTSVACAYLLFSSFRRTGSQLLLYSALCFSALFLANGMLIVDKVLGIQDLVLWRNVAASIGMGCLLFGFIWEGF
jgi:hypothetical protein